MISASLGLASGQLWSRSTAPLSHLCLLQRDLNLNLNLKFKLRLSLHRNKWPPSNEKKMKNSKNSTHPNNPKMRCPPRQASQRTALPSRV